MHSVFQITWLQHEECTVSDMSGGWILKSCVWISIAAIAPESLAARVVLSCGSVGKELEICKASAQAWAQKTGNDVEVVPSPAASGERFAQYQLLLAAGSSDIDIFLIDATWPGMLGDFFVDLKKSPGIREMIPRFFRPFIESNTVQDRLVALPWFVDAGILYFRKDLLERYHQKIPNTWEELTDIAGKIQNGERSRGKSRFWGYVFQGRAYEGLTCNALEWVASFGGGSIVDSFGQVTIDNPDAARALQLASTWIGSIAPRGVLNYMEEDSRAVFQSGDAAFMRNWPYALKLVNSPDSAVRGRVGISTLPAGTGPGSKNASTLGGWSLAVSRYSKVKEAAVSLVGWLARPEEQKRRALALGQNPTIESLYADSELVQKNPEFPYLRQIFNSAVARPSRSGGPKYNRISSEFWDSVHEIISRSVVPEAGLRRLGKKLESIQRKGRE